MKKIILVTEFFNHPFDEGIKKSVYNLYLKLSENHEVRVVCRYGSENQNIYVCNTNRLFISIRLYKYIRTINPDLLIYFPFQSSTFASFLRNKILKVLSGNIKMLFIALQPKKLNRIKKILLDLIKPEIVLTSSVELRNLFEKNNIKTKLIPLYTQLNKFSILKDNSKKNILRKKYNLSDRKKIITHVGHVRNSRNLESLIEIQRYGYQVLIISSTSTPDSSQSDFLIQKNDLIFKLKSEGIIVIEDYISNISEIYHISDVYVFPVIEPNACIDLPLSILEARACGIPCVSTNFGSIKHFLGNDYNGIRYSQVDKLRYNIDYFIKSKKKYYKSNVKKLNDKFTTVIENFIKN